MKRINEFYNNKII